jgi:hypothetical protein
MTRFLFMLLALGLGFGCARSSAHIAFDESLRDVDRRARTGDAQAIAAEYHALAKRSYKASDKVELRLRAVDVLIRARDSVGALVILKELKTTNLDRPHAGLVQLRYARIVERVLDRPDRALSLYTQVITENVDNMASRLGLRDVRIMFLSQEKDAAWRAYLSKLTVEVSGTRFEKVLWVHRAEQHIVDGEEHEAIALLFPIHRKHKGARVWYRASNMLTKMFKKLKMPEHEAEILEGLANHLERTTMLGSYDSALYTRGELRLAELYCLELDRAEDGVRWMVGFEGRHPYSTLRDDALWRLSQCYESQGEQLAQQETLCSILQRFPLTRNARRARKTLGMTIGPGLGGSGSEALGPQPCGPIAPTAELVAGPENP